MKKPKGVWLQTTELTDIQEAQVLKNGQSRPFFSSVSKEARGRRPLLIGSLAVCCCALLAIVGLHVFPSLAAVPETAQTPPFDTDAIRAVILAENEREAAESLIVPMSEPEPEPLTEPEAAESKPETEPKPEPVTEPETAAQLTPLASAAPPARDDTITVASRSGEGGADTITVNGETFNYTRRISVESTAYTWTGKTTATGTWPELGTVAVDPNIIPLGTKLYVVGYGFATAADTGGAIKGNIIDVYFPELDTCIKWGRKHSVTVYILE